jgi:uncharacterized membrane protein YczE
MVGTQRKLGIPFWIVRTIYEATVLTVGWLLGGQVRAGHPDICCQYRLPHAVVAETFRS